MMSRRNRAQSDPKNPVTEPDDGTVEAEEDEAPAPETPPEPEPEALPHIPQQVVNPPYEPPPLPETPTAGTEPEPMEKRDG